MSRFSSARALRVAVALAATLAGCDKDLPKGERAEATGAASSTPTATPPTGAATPTPAAVSPKLQLAVDDNAAFIAGERFDLAAPNPKGRLVAALEGKPVDGETVVLNASRDAKLPKVVWMMSALAAKKAKAVEIHTPRRDRSPADIVFVIGAKAEPCSTVGFIAKDNAITTWPVSAATAERFTHGMAGPDLTRGSEGIRKRVLTCDAPAWFVSADDIITWGLVFDLALAVLRPDDAGLPKPRSVALLTKPPVPGRRVAVDEK